MSMRVPGGLVSVGARVRQMTNIDSGSGPKCSRPTFGSNTITFCKKITLL